MITAGVTALIAGAATLAVGGPAAHAVESGPACALVAHRGAHSATATENGLKAMQAAVAGGADWLEIDVRASSDDRLYLMHDSRVDRTTTSTGAVRRMTATQLGAVRLDDGGVVPTLDRVLRLAGNATRPVLLEIKALSTVTAYKRLAASIRTYGGGRVVVQSFDATHLSTIRRYAPDVPQALLTRTAPTARVARRYGTVSIDYAAITEEWLVSMEGAGIRVFAWTANTADVWDRLAGRVAGMITDVTAEYAGYRSTAPACQAG